MGEIQTKSEASSGLERQKTALSLTECAREMEANAASPGLVGIVGIHLIKYNFVVSKIHINKLVNSSMIIIIALFTAWYLSFYQFITLQLLIYLNDQQFDIEGCVIVTPTCSSTDSDTPLDSTLPTLRLSRVMKRGDSPTANKGKRGDSPLKIIPR